MRYYYAAISRLKENGQISTSLVYTHIHRTDSVLQARPIARPIVGEPSASRASIDQDRYAALLSAAIDHMKGIMETEEDIMLGTL